MIKPPHGYSTANPPGRDGQYSGASNSGSTSREQYPISTSQIQNESNINAEKHNNLLSLEIINSIELINTRIKIECKNLYAFSIYSQISIHNANLLISNLKNLHQTEQIESNGIQHNIQRILPKFNINLSNDIEKKINKSKLNFEILASSASDFKEQIKEILNADNENNGEYFFYDYILGGKPEFIPLCYFIAHAKTVTDNLKTIKNIFDEVINNHQKVFLSVKEPFLDIHSAITASVGLCLMISGFTAIMTPIIPLFISAPLFLAGALIIISKAWLLTQVLLFKREERDLAKKEFTKIKEQVNLIFKDTKPFIDGKLVFDAELHRHDASIIRLYDGLTRLVCHKNEQAQDLNNLLRDVPILKRSINNLAENTINDINKLVDYISSQNNSTGVREADMNNIIHAAQNSMAYTGINRTPIWPSSLSSSPQLAAYSQPTRQAEPLITPPASQGRRFVPEPVLPIESPTLRPTFQAESPITPQPEGSRSSISKGKNRADIF